MTIFNTKKKKRTLSINAAKLFWQKLRGTEHASKIEQPKLSCKILLQKLGWDGRMGGNGLLCQPVLHSKMEHLIWNNYSIPVLTETYFYGDAIKKFFPLFCHSCHEIIDFLQKVVTTN